MNRPIKGCKIERRREKNGFDLLCNLFYWNHANVLGIQKMRLIKLIVM